jgi:putative acetyltransferase
VIFTKCDVRGSDASAVLLGPLAVAPAWQRRGVGSALVRTGLRRLEDMGVGLVFVLGDPAYYERFGFRHESTVEPPFVLPDEYVRAWQSQSFGEKKLRCSGRLSVPRQWLEPALWGP